MNEKVVCEDYKCGWHGLLKDVLEADNPFVLGDKIYACPECREVGTIREACDEPDCWQPSTCGFPTENGYRRTCGKHYKK